MRTPHLALLIAAALAACGEAEPPKPVVPPKPVALAPQPAPAPRAATPVPSAEELLRARVEKALRDTREVDGQGVDVTVAGGAVSLFGTVPSESERRKVERFVAGIDGVQSVINKLVVVRGS